MLGRLSRDVEGARKVNVSNQCKLNIWYLKINGSENNFMDNGLYDHGLPMFTN
jgi:hypothetical protein